MNIVQIGTHKAYDDLYSIVSEINPSDIENLILIEPQEQYNPSISECYNRYNPSIENILIHYKDIDNEYFYYTNETEVSSIKSSHLIEHYQSNYNIISKKCITINKLFEKYKMSKIDILFIDAEGIDDEIIYSIDFDKYDVSEIYYENLHINNASVENFLVKKNYSVTKNVLSNGWTNKAKKLI
jgi:hypothetical protein